MKNVHRSTSAKKTLRMFSEGGGARAVAVEAGLFVGLADGEADQAGNVSPSKFRSVPVQLLLDGPSCKARASTGRGELPGILPAALERQRLFLVPPPGKGRENMSHSEWPRERSGVFSGSIFSLWSHR